MGIGTDKLNDWHHFDLKSPIQMETNYLSNAFETMKFSKDTPNSNWCVCFSQNLSACDCEFVFFFNWKLNHLFNDDNISMYSKIIAFLHRHWMARPYRSDCIVMYTVLYTMKLVWNFQIIKSLHRTISQYNWAVHSCFSYGLWHHVYMNLSINALEAVRSF